MKMLKHRKTSTGHREDDAAAQKVLKVPTHAYSTCTLYLYVAVTGRKLFRFNWLC